MDCDLRTSRRWPSRTVKNTRIIRALKVVVLALSLSCSSSAPEESAQVSEREVALAGSVRIGLNLSAVNYYATQVPFEDVFLNRESWISTDGNTWDTGMMSQIPLLSDGYPAQIPSAGQMVQVPVFRPVYRTTFNVTWDGAGVVQVFGADLDVLSSSANALQIDVPRNLQDFVTLRIVSSTLNNHVRNIRFTPVTPVTTDFAAMVQGLHVLRFMDWGATNNNEVAAWADRTLPGHPQGTSKGVAIETMIDTANRYKADLWYTIPHQANDAFMEAAATMIRDRLDPALKVYVEYSNENWNGIFEQHRWEQDQGVSAGLHHIGPNQGEPTDPNWDEVRFWTGMKYSVRRAAKAHSVFRTVFGTRAASRVVAVLAGQSANPDLNNDLLNLYEDVQINPIGGRADALAVAPYFGTNYEPADGIHNLTNNQVLDQVEATLAVNVGEHTARNKGFANAHGVQLIAYEAGQHLTISPYPAGQEANYNAAVQRIASANRSSRMGTIYRKAQELWAQNGGGLMVYFASCEPSGPHGAWGALEEQRQKNVPKMLAIRQGLSLPEQYVGLRAKSNARFVLADNDGRNPLRNAGTRIDRWEKFRLVTNIDSTVSLRSEINGRFVSVGSVGTDPLRASADKVGSAEKFLMEYTADNFRVLKAVVNSRYVTFDPSGNVPATAQATQPLESTKFTTEDWLPDRLVSLRAWSNSRFVTATPPGDGPLLNNATDVGPSQKFIVHTNPDGTTSIRAEINGRYITAENAGASPLYANRTGVGDWEKFAIVLNPFLTSAIRAVNQKYVVFDASGTIAASARSTSTTGPTEVTINNLVRERLVALRAKINDRIVTATSGGASPLVNQNYPIDDWEKFYLLTNADGTVSLRAEVNGRYVAPDNNGAGPLMANRTSIGSWEKFEIVPSSDGFVALRAVGNTKYVTFNANATTGAIAQGNSLTEAEKLTIIDL